MVRRLGLSETQLVQFRLIQMPCCGQSVCWVNPRFPNYCPECGKFVYPDVKAAVVVSEEAVLKIG
jgi:hypothetical protein